MVNPMTANLPTQEEFINSMAHDKLVWESAPEWAAYAAMDHDGVWFFYEHKPYIQGNYWGCPGKYIQAAIDNSDWRNSLTPRPQE
jgi:hypothetical protein